MQYYMEEYGKYIEITGYRNIAFALAEQFLKENRKKTQTADSQFFDADLIATQEHLYFAALNALQAFKGKTNISKSPAMETMLYASAQRQIQKAIERCGIKPQTTNMAIVIIGGDQKQIETLLKTVTKCIGMEPDENVLAMTTTKEEKIKKAFEITEEELKTVTKDGDHEKAIVNLVIECVALLVTQL
jgi:KEOPS complex subunit Cgi121